MVGRASPQPPPAMLPKQEHGRCRGRTVGHNKRARTRRAAIDERRSSLPSSAGRQSFHLRNRRQYIPASRDNKQSVTSSCVHRGLLLEGFVNTSMLGRASPQPPPTMLPRTRPRQVQGMDGGSQQARRDALRSYRRRSSLPSSAGRQSLHLRNRRQYIPARWDNKQTIPGWIEPSRRWDHPGDGRIHPEMAGAIWG